MKKRYLQPEVQAFIVSPCQMVAASITVTESNATVELDDEEYDGTFHSRRTVTVWDDEEDSIYD